MLTDRLNVTLAQVDKEIEATETQFKARLRHLRALRRVLADESPAPTPVVVDTTPQEPDPELDAALSEVISE